MAYSRDDFARELLKAVCMVSVLSSNGLTTVFVFLFVCFCVYFFSPRNLQFPRVQSLNISKHLLEPNTASNTPDFCVCVCVPLFLDVFT